MKLQLLSQVELSFEQLSDRLDWNTDCCRCQNYVDSSMQTR